MDCLLEWFGAERYRQTLDIIRRFWEGEGRCLISVASSHAGYRQLFDDDAILDRAVENLRSQADLPGANMPTFFADFGTVSTARYWGGAPRFDSTGENLFIDPVADDLAAALRLTPCNADDPSHDGARGVRLFDALSERLQSDHLWMRSPDLQGVLNTAGLVMRQEVMLMAMYDDPDGLHRFLDRVGDFLIAYVGYLRDAAKGRLGGNIWPYTFLPISRGVSFTEDLMPLLSSDLYRTFGLPYVERLSRAFGGVQIHCCGEWARHVAGLAESDATIHAVEFHHPATPVEALAPLFRTTVLIPYLIADRQDRFPDLYDYWRWLLRHTEARFWFLPGDDDAGLAFCRENAHLMPRGYEALV